jgi:hypothetical protein
MLTLPTQIKNPCTTIKNHFMNPGKRTIATGKGENMLIVDSIHQM